MASQPRYSDVNIKMTEFDYAVLEALKEMKSKTRKRTFFFK